MTKGEEFPNKKHQTHHQITRDLSSMTKGEEFPNKKHQTHYLNIGDQLGITKGEKFLSKMHPLPPQSASLAASWEQSD